MKSNTELVALRDAIKKAGGQAKLAEHVGVGQTAVANWVNRSKRIPVEHVLDVERVTGVSRHALRPDIYPLERRA